MLSTIRVVGAFVSASISATAIALDVAAVSPDKPFGIYALIALAVFIALVVWGWGQAEYQLRSKSRINRALSDLATKRSDGATLLNEGIIASDSDKLVSWWVKVDKWQDDVRAGLRQIHPAAPDNWKALGMMKVRQFQGVTDPTQVRLLMMLSDRMDKLETFINDRTK